LFNWCGLGEVAGMIVSVWLNLDNHTSMILSIIMGAIFGFSFGMIPLKRAGFTWKYAFRQVLIAEGLSIAVMETFEALVQIYMPGVMDAKLNDWIFWEGMILSLIAGFVAAYPVNYLFVRKGIRHQH
jgi:Domain of unknown function (DUF4396)